MTLSPGVARRPRAAVASETAERVELPGGPLAYTLRRSRRASRLRLVVDPIRGVVVTIPAGRPGARDAAAHVEPFLLERETWIRRHLTNHARERATVAGSAPEALVDGARLRFRGVVHALRVEPAGPGVRRSAVLSGLDGTRRSPADDGLDWASGRSSSGSLPPIDAPSPSSSRRGSVSGRSPTSTMRSSVTPRPSG